MKNLKEIWDYREMIASLVRRDLRGRYKGSVLGFLWTFLNPLLQLVVYTVVFSVIMRAGIEDYYLFLFVALVPWTFFSTAVGGGAGCIVTQQNLVNKIYFPREVLPISHVISQLINMLLSFLVVIAVLLISGKGINLAVWGYLPIIILQETLLAFGLTLLCSAITVYFRDMQFLLNVIMMAWQFLTPVMYSVDMVPERLRGLFYLNPMTPIIVAYRDIFYYKQAPDLHDFLLGTIMGVVMLIIGWFSFGKLKRRFAEVM
ncbi:MAG: ABC transporter permease [Lachnospiraceae bacterium]|nr:ABC transporter permease [Lachnospiraceae bacterium]